MVVNFIHIPKNGGTSIKDICDSKHIKYNGHGTDVRNPNLKDQMVILRHPIERFISAVYYCLEKWSHLPQVKYLIDNKIDTPEKWVQIWKNKEHPEHNRLMAEMLNIDHNIGNRKPKYKWTYALQKNWINKPKYVCIMDTLEDDLQYFLDKIGYRKKLDKKNFTKKKYIQLSKSSELFLKKFYKQDFIIYNHFKNISRKTRLS